MKKLALTVGIVALLAAASPADAQFPGPGGSSETRDYVGGTGIAITCGDPGIGKACFGLSTNVFEVDIVETKDAFGAPVGGSYRFLVLFGSSTGGMLTCDGQALNLAVPPLAYALEVIPGDPGCSGTPLGMSAKGSVTIWKS